MIIGCTDQSKRIGKLYRVMLNHQLHIGMSTDLSVIRFPNQSGNIGSVWHKSDIIKKSLELRLIV